MAYDDADVTERERLAADRTNQIAQFNAQAVRNQLARTLGNYDLANEQNAAMRDMLNKQTRRKGETDRFEAARNLQNAALGLFGSMNQAMNGSTVGNTMYMLNNRNDSDNNVYWQQQADNLNANDNSYLESYNQNNVAAAESVSNAAKALNDIEADTAANLSNINPNLYVAPGTGDARLGSDTLYNENMVNPNLAVLSGYLIPENAEQTVRPRRNRMLGTDYYSALMNRFNNR